jgi:hypothetical protein
MPGDISSPAEEPGAPAYHSPEWHGELKQWLKAHCPVPTRLDRHIFGRIAAHLSPALLEGFFKAAAEVASPRRWAIYEDIARQVADRGELPKIPPGKAEIKAARAAEFKREMLAKYGGKNGKRD